MPNKLYKDNKLPCITLFPISNGRTDFHSKMETLWNTWKCSNLSAVSLNYNFTERIMQSFFSLFASHNFLHYVYFNINFHNCNNILISNIFHSGLNSCTFVLTDGKIQTSTFTYLHKAQFLIYVQTTIICIIKINIFNG